MPLFNTKLRQPKSIFGNQSMQIPGMPNYADAAVDENDELPMPSTTTQSTAAQAPQAQMIDGLMPRPEEQYGKLYKSKKYNGGY